MLRTIVSFFRMRHNPLPPGPLKKSERRLVTEMLESKDPTDLIAAMDCGNIKIVQKFGRNYASTGGQIKICMDIYGPEVHIRGGEMLDCRPESYGLTRANGERLYLAILAAYNSKTSIEFSEDLAYSHQEELDAWKCQEEMFNQIRGYR